MRIFSHSAFLFARALFLILGIFVFSQGAYAGMDGDTSNDLYGFAWSENIGYISFSCTDAGGCNTVRYGVEVASIDTEYAYLSGYAYSPNVGWISFEDADVAGCPAPSRAGDCSPKIDLSDGNLIGWAKVVSTDSWVNLTGEVAGGDSYGADFDFPGTIFSGLAFESGDTGWVSFNSSDLASPIEYAVRGPVIESGEPPTVPGNLTLYPWCSSNQGKITVTFGASTGNEPITYTIYKGGSTLVSGLTGRTYTDTVSLNTNYSYKVSAQNDFGSSGQSGAQSATVSSDLCNQPVTLDSFTANPPLVNIDEACTLQWQFDTGAGEGTRCEINWPSGTQTVAWPDNDYAVNLRENTTYTIRCTNDDGVTWSDPETATCAINPKYKEVR